MIYIYIYMIYIFIFMFCYMLFSFHLFEAQKDSLGKGQLSLVFF